MNARLVRLLPVLFCLAAASLPAHDYFVALDGNDAAPGTLERPFLSFKRAEHALGPGDTLYLRGGVYRSILYACADGTPGAPIVFRPWRHESVVLAGSDPAQGTWRPWRGRIWRLERAPPAYDLFLDGTELSGARWPARPFGSGMDAGWATAGPGTGPGVLRDPGLPKLDLEGARVHIVPGLAWVGFTRGVSPAGPGRLRFQGPLDPRPAYAPRPGNRYYLYGSLALLTAPGQWWQDPKSGDLYLWTPAGDDPARHDVELGRRKMVVYDNGFSYVRFRGFHTFCGAVKLSHCVGCRVLGLDQRYVQHYDEVGGYAAEPPTNGLYQCVGCEWGGGAILGSSGDGLAVSGRGDRVDHMLIQDVDESGGYAAAIALLGKDQVAEDDTCHDAGRTLIDLGNARGGAVRHDELYRAGLLTEDVGAIYAYQDDGGGMVIAYNDIHGVAARRGMGIYLDNGDSDFVVHHNLVHGCAWAALELNLPSHGNRVYNNTLWGCRHWVWADGAPHSMTGTVLENNLFSGDHLLVKGRLAPLLRDNQGFLPPSGVFRPGSFELAQGSPALGRGLVAPPYTDGWKGSGPDLGALAHGAPAWSAGSGPEPSGFPYPWPSALAAVPPRPGRRWW